VRKGRATILAVLALMVPVGATRAHACGVASHTFAVFLGWLDGKPVHLETELVRRDIRLRSKPWMELRWRGSARTIVAGTPAPPAAAPIWKGEVVNKELAPQIAGWVKGELSRLASDPGFVAAGMPDHRYCDFSRACGDLWLET